MRIKFTYEVDDIELEVKADIYFDQVNPGDKYKPFLEDIAWEPAIPLSRSVIAKMEREAFRQLDAEAAEAEQEYLHYRSR